MIFKFPGFHGPLLRYLYVALHNLCIEKWREDSFMQVANRLIHRRQSPTVRLLAMFLSFLALWLVAASSGSAAASYSSQLRRYTYLTDAVGPYATINWATDRSQTSGAV